MKLKAVVAMLVLMLAAASAQAEEIIAPGEVLTVQRCVAIALQRRPNIMAAKSAVDIGTSRIGQAQSNYYPQIDANAAYSRVDPVSGSSGLKTSRSYDQYSGNVMLNQLLFDFGRTGTQVSIERLNRDAAQSDLQNTEEQVVFQVKLAYYNLLRAQRTLDVAEQTVKQAEEHLAQAKGFYEVGTKPKFDVTRAEVDLSTAKLARISAANGVKVARVTLNTAMGFPETGEYSVEDNLTAEKFPLSREEVLSRAYENRPDLVALRQRIRAAEESVSLAQKNYFPILTGNAAYNRAGDRFPLDDGWSAGVSLTVPIFSGFLTKNQVAEAKATLEVVRANEESQRLAVTLEVQAAYLKLLEAEERIQVAELTVRQAEENHEIATGRYAAGVGNPIEVTDAEVTLASARVAHIQALCDYKIAVADLERAIGVR